MPAASSSFGRVSPQHNKRLEICRDPKDDKFLELAICGSATHLITGDDDLLVLNPFRNVEILKSSDFVSNYS
jgi:uncharacterized protein